MQIGPLAFQNLKSDVCLFSESLSPPSDGFTGRTRVRVKKKNANDFLVFPRGHAFDYRASLQELHRNQ